MYTFHFTDGRTDEVESLSVLVDRHFTDGVAVNVEWIAREGIPGTVWNQDGAVMLLMPESDESMFIAIAAIDTPAGRIGPEQASHIRNGTMPDPFRETPSRPRALLERIQALSDPTARLDATAIYPVARGTTRGLGL